MSDLIFPIEEYRITSPYNFSYNLNSSSFMKQMLFKGNLIVDTGCVRTSISAWDSIKDTKKLLYLKGLEIDNYRSGKVKCIVNHGMFEGKDCIKSVQELRKLKKEELMKVKNISFRHVVKDFSLNGVNFGEIALSITYDRKTSSLLGMNFLQRYNSEIRVIGNSAYFILDNGKSENKSLYRLAVEGLNNHFKVSDVKKNLLMHASEEEVNALLIEVLGEEYLIP